MRPLQAPLWIWAATVAALIAVICADLIVSVRRPGPVRMRDAALWSAAAVALAIAFGTALALAGHRAASGQFFAGWLTEYSLSVDNLFVFVLLISRSAVPRELHSRVLLLGVALAPVLRGIFIGLGGSALHHFGWLLYLFGAFLLYTAVRLAVSSRPGRRSSEEGIPRVVQVLLRRSGATGAAHAAQAGAGTGRARPAFALDSIPAIFGLTREPYLVFTANAFGLLGLRHLYFMIGGLLGQLAYLAAGLAAVLGFIGVKLITTALRESGVSELGPVPVPHVSTGVSLAVIMGVIGTVVITSLLASGRQPRPEGAAPLAGARCPGPS